MERATGPDREIDALLYGMREGLVRNEGTFSVIDKWQFAHWHPLSPTSIAILGRLRIEISNIEQDIDRATHRPEYKATPDIQLMPETPEWQTKPRSLAGSPVDQREVPTKPMP